MKLSVRLLSALFVLIFTLPSRSQTISDSLFVAHATNYTVNNYLNQLKSEAPIYDGQKYLPDLRLDENGHTLFLSNQYTKGSVVYDGHLFNNVDMEYDLVHDQLVLLNYDRVSGIVLKQAHVDSFYLHGHSFVHIRPADIKAKEIRPGYFELLYNGKVDLLAKRIKTISETTTQYKVKRTVEQQDFYYVHKDSSYIRIRNKKDLFSVFGDTHTSKESQQYLKSQHINFRKDKEKAMLALLKWHDSKM
ncbi:hypothetical protein BCY91_10920 [Pelobium manganitolerans]|uniref:Organic solvent tolerance-like N-terminal domain-containing protein n=1 Tax=Pelobium manganitolerans TaxID=1842495 RepID=A0A419S2U3_9SPHI|nr:hypothetical protein [Pelobium manganitolerans]RKD13311.1 hypothetical protein BCY91_10920 [Pelobium manganitolerans]